MKVWGEGEGPGRVVRVEVLGGVVRVEVLGGW